MWPIGSIFYIAVLNRIYVDVFDMCMQILLITNLMLPISTLPYTSFASFYTNPRQAFGFWYPEGEIRFYPSPSRGEVAIIFR